MLPIRVFQLREINLGREQMISAETGIEVPQVEEAVDQQTCTDEEDERSCNFGHDQQATDPHPLAPTRGITAAFLKRVVEAKVRRLRGRRKAEDQARDNGH